MQASSKRTVQVNVKMSAEDFASLKEAADALWPDAVLTNSSIVLGLAKLGSAQIRKGVRGQASSSESPIEPQLQPKTT
jgi:hypothetical protein